MQVLPPITQLVTYRGLEPTSSNPKSSALYMTPYMIHLKQLYGILSRTHPKCNCLLITTIFFSHTLRRQRVYKYIIFVK